LGSNRQLIKFNKLNKQQLPGGLSKSEIRTEQIKGIN